MKILKSLLVTVLAVALILMVVIVWYRWDSTRNRGIEFGYYGEFNRVSNALASIPNVKVTESWHNLDVTLEEFGFDINIAGHAMHLAFGETDSIRKMSHDEMVAALKTRIATNLSADKK